ncbi:FAD-dependent monooxygenase [Pandoraea norimbergensis]|uniref:FAD-dependent monooxygenase n=1 Tax=Pandoraea norimbergensis TaxID=93219 RepID=UPI000B138077|nr:FAD-dependent monooxygenase [Pandoraea norimbergensis]
MIYEVIIAGAGPVGLFLACELRLAGLSVLVLEQAETPESPLKRLPFGLRGLSMPTLDAFYRRGLLDDITAPQRAKANTGTNANASVPHWMQQARRPGGHFAGIQFFQDDIDTSKWPYFQPNPAGTIFAVDMEHIETVLATRAIASGAQIRRGCGVDGFDTTDDGVTVHANGEIFRAQWLIGCDGARSAVRKAAGIEFVGTDPEFTGYSVQVELADPDKLTPGRHYTPTGMYTYQPPGTVAMADFDGGAFHRTQPITREHVQTVLRRVSNTDVTVNALSLATTWTDRAHQATTYRKGRVLLAGDAAHIHSPMGGQGLNLGLGDAMNLAWKLAATVRGDAPPDLLDTYTTERHPVGAQVLDWSRAQIGIMRPAPSSRALEAILRDVLDTRDGATYFAERVWGACLRYDLGSEHPLVGRSAPDFEFVDGKKLGALLTNGKGLLLDFDADTSLKTLANRWRDRFAYVGCDAKHRFGLRAVLLRPDGFVAWASDTSNSNDPNDPNDPNAPRSATPPDLDALAQAASRWFGAPNDA